jgi:Zn-finger nucleic acid-binding protein
MVDHDLRDFESQNPMYLDTVPNAKHPEEPVFSMVGTGPLCENPGLPVTMVCQKCKCEIETRSSSCGRVECPQCWGTWARRAAERAAARTWGAFEAGVSQHHPRHITFDIDTVDWKQAKQKALDFGFTGGLLVIHPWRIKPSYQAELAELAEKLNVNRYEAWRRSGLGMDALLWSPHVHAVCYGKGIPIKQGTHDYEYKMIRKLNSLDAVQGVAFYVLSHTFTPLTPNHRAYRYFGICSPQKLKPDWVGQVSDLLRCPNCGFPMVFEGSNECKEVSTYTTRGWHEVIKIPGVKVPGSGGQKKQIIPTPEPFYAWDIAV